MMMMMMMMMMIMMMMMMVMTFAGGLDALRWTSIPARRSRSSRGMT
jgi:hypothetical protein